MKSGVKSLIFAILALALVGAMKHRFGLMPPIGELLNPFNGSWKRAPHVFEKREGQLRAQGLREKVDIIVDADQITHVFAKNDHDLYFAQGYVVASERLWQMEFLVRTASGRLSEILGPKTLDYDTYFTRLGLPAAAEASATLMLQDPVTAEPLKAYADGVNAFIATLTPETMPIEYKLLGVKPRAWDPRTAGYLLKFMAWSLAGGASEVPLSRSEHVLGRAGFEELFPLDIKVPEPIIPPGTKQIVKSVAPPAPKEFFEPRVDSLQPMPTPHPSNGSNNWAVSGKKSTTGQPILSNDIHLSLTLPALWYEMQLTSPTQSVYGIALPGVPGIVLGFNRSIAWGATNGADDVMDWYQLRFRDEKQSEYYYDGVWHPVISREVKIPVRGQADVTLTLRETSTGPIVYPSNETPLSVSIGPGLALRWMALNESNEVKSFILMNRAKSSVEFRRALDGYQTPSMNFLVADNTGAIELWQFGRYPLKWKGQGRLIGDGSSSAYDWKGYLTADEVPHVRNPARGFISSANQPPFAPGDSPFYFGWPFETPYRITRINEMLRAKKTFAPEDFIRMQRDTLSVSMRELTPLLRSALRGVALNERETAALKTLDGWDFRFEEDSRGAPLAYAWYKEIELGLWSRLLPDRKAYWYPSLPKTIEILQDPKSHWYDNPATDVVETRATVVHDALSRAIADVAKACAVDSCTWAHYRPTNLEHIGKIPGLGVDGMPGAGMEHTVFANTGTHGPVWKMVVAVGTDGPRAWGVYPGGQSGDPFSPHFADFLPAWRRGDMKPLRFMNDAVAGPRMEMSP